MATHANGAMTGATGRRGALALTLLLAAACGEADRGEPRAEAHGTPPGEVPLHIAMSSPRAACEILADDMTLPREARESSGLARSRLDPDLFWTHNDAGNEPELFGVDGNGALVRHVRVAGARLVDWEDIEAAPCGDGGCLYVADIGDNDGDRERITVYRVEEPEAGATATAAAEPLHARYPDGPRDAESLFVDASGDLFVVTKGRREAITLYRWPRAAPGATVTLEPVRDLFPRPDDELDRVTAATATPDGRWVGMRTYRTLYLFPADRLIGTAAIRPEGIDLSVLGQEQGEGLALGDDGTVWVSTEAQGKRAPGWSRLKCAFPDPGAGESAGR